MKPDYARNRLSAGPKGGVYALLLFLLPFLALTSSVLGRIRELRSPQMTMSTLAAVSIVGAVIGLVLLALDKSKWQTSRYITIVRITIMATITFVHFDVAYGGMRVPDRIRDIANGVASWQTFPINAVFVVLSISLIGALLWKLASNAVPILSAIFAVSLLTTLLISGPRPLNNWTRISLAQDKGSVDGQTGIFTILDGMIGAEGIDRALPGGE